MNVVESAIRTIKEASIQSTGGMWLEELTVGVAPYIRDWDIREAHRWHKWPDRETYFPGTTNQDIGIDVVAIRYSDGRLIAIQCKSRKLDEYGRGGDIHKSEIDKFATASASSLWAERWIVTNGDIHLSHNTQQVLSMQDKKITPINITSDLIQQQASFHKEECPHCQPHASGQERTQTRTCMQSEAVTESIRILREHEQSETGGLPKGQARGKIILPCGTGKTRISLRIVEELTEPGSLAIVLCPSIALVAQIRREFLQHTAVGIRALAVCSDETAGYDPKKEGKQNTAEDPTIDNSNVSAFEVKGRVTTDPKEIAGWIQQGSNVRSVIFGTYQSSHKVAEALRSNGSQATVLVADEAHRTAGLRRKRKAKSDQATEQERRIRDFTLCHDNDRIPATYRIYQTATPRIYDTRTASKSGDERPSDWIVRSMDDEAIFGVELYRKSYIEAVQNSWLSDYRIIALGINDPEAFKAANELAGKTKAKGKNALTTSDYLRGLALALTMAGATQDRRNGNVPIKSCIAFMNTVSKSRAMAEDLQSDTVKRWVQQWLDENRTGQKAAAYRLEHLDATSNVIGRDTAKSNLASATTSKPHGIINVGIFGEGTDSPSLSAVAFLEPRKSPIDVIQAVGRAMRTSVGKSLGYIVCPILIPHDANPEEWLSTSNMNDGWEELGQILLALRAHDKRIEDELSSLLHLYLPKAPEVVRTVVAIGSGEDKRIHYREHTGAPGTAQQAVARVADRKSTLNKEFGPISESTDAAKPDATSSALETAGKLPRWVEPTQIVTGKRTVDGSLEIRIDSVVRSKAQTDGILGPIDFRKTKSRAKEMINKGKGVRVRLASDIPKDHTPPKEKGGQQMLSLSGMEEYGNAIRMNLLSKSGLTGNRIVRDLNILEESVREASYHLRKDGLSHPLDEHFGLNALQRDNLQHKKSADGCTIVSLLMMNAAMLHQRISNGGWLTGVSDLSTIKNDVQVVRKISREWERIMRHDFRPVLEPVLEAIYAIEETGKIGGLERALRLIAAEAERIAGTYADMGADHAGPLFNKVMGNQASDGAFFTRPVAASVAARVTMDALSDVDWTDPEVWRKHKVIDLACGSGTLLAAILTDLKRRAKEQGASDEQLGELQKVAVEDVLKGLDINPVSLQLAASQLTAGNQNVSYLRMGLHLMPYGPQVNDTRRISAGTLELLGQRRIVSRPNELDLPDEKIESQAVWEDRAELEESVEAAKGAKIVIMNPPFTNRTKMGEKFPPDIQSKLRQRIDLLEKMLTRTDPQLGFTDKNSIRPLFVALADRCLSRPVGTLALINPTIVLTAPSGLQERRVLAQRYHIDTILTCHQPSNINMSQNTAINESIVVMRRLDGPKPPTRFINLDRLPTDDNGVEDFHSCLLDCHQGLMANGWGEVSQWPEARILDGVWTPAIWRSPALAEAAFGFASHPNLHQISDLTERSIPFTGRDLFRGRFERSEEDILGSFGVLDSKSESAQTAIRSLPDRYWVLKNRNKDDHQYSHETHPEVRKMLKKAGYLLITAGQDSSAARLTATADDTSYVGNSWMPVPGFSPREAKAVAVFMNSTPGRLQLMQYAGRKLTFPTYRPASVEKIRVPNIKDEAICSILVSCWERTSELTVPQFRDGECEVRRLWDEAIANAMDWDAGELAYIRELLHSEPHVRGVGYGEYTDKGDE